MNDQNQILGEERKSAEKTPEPKKPYHAPRFVQYGDITKLTKGSFPTNNNDGMGMMIFPPCL